MKRFKRGFTLIEVSLFLALTALLFVGIAVGVQNSIYQQRFNDAVQNFAEFLRTAYSQVLNVQSEGTGRSDKAIYGKLITFNVDSDTGKNVINTYNVIGDVSNSIGTGTAIGLLEELEGNVVIEEEDAGGGKTYTPVGFVENYTPRWGAAIQKSDGSKDPFVGALLIIRHPLSGTVYTYVTDSNVVNENNFSDVLSSEEGGFKIDAVDFCVNPNGPGEGGVRRDVRVVNNARNASGIEIVSDAESACERI
ncbi:hypothetical protein IJJ05_00245 [Candidatus Saccharibacteria bacterium]|nr:hypothetical protein [Candidatus Saccharibacteria bacterium]